VCVQKFPDWPPGARTANGIGSLPLGASYCYFVSQSSEFYRHNPLCCFSTSSTKGKRIFPYDSVRELLDSPSYIVSLAVNKLIATQFSYPSVKVKLSLCLTKHNARPYRESNPGRPPSSLVTTLIKLCPLLAKSME
jgi:hypothetical protein